MPRREKHLHHHHHSAAGVSSTAGGAVVVRGARSHVAHVHCCSRAVSSGLIESGRRRGSRN